MKLPDLYFIIDSYLTNFETEAKMQSEFLKFISENENCFYRHLLIGHITASAFIFDKIEKKVLLIHHKKLDKWLQPGGHCDGVEDTLEVAIKEVKEETGLLDFKYENKIFDIDIHEIPERKEIPKHKHYDVRYLFLADSNKLLTQNHETFDLKWIYLSHISDFTTEESIFRMANKISHLEL